MNLIYERESIEMGTRVLSRAVENDVLDSCIVPIDVSKYFHEAMIFGPGGQVLEDPSNCQLPHPLGILKPCAQFTLTKSKNKSIHFAYRLTSI